MASSVQTVQDQINTAAATAQSHAITATKPGGCRVLFSNWIKSFQSSRDQALPVDFPAGAAYGSMELRQWAEKDAAYNWRRLPRYFRWMQSSNDAFQTDLATKGKTQKIVARLLDVCLLESSPAGAPMGLSNFGTGGVVGKVIGDNGQALLSSKPNAGANELAVITFQGGKDTFFMTPFIEKMAQSADEAVCFPVLILPKAQDNEGGLGTRFLYFTFQFPVKIFDGNPAPSNSGYVLRVSQYHALVPLIQDIERDISLGSNDKAAIFTGIVGMLRTAIQTTTMGQYEQRVSTIMKNWLSARLVEPVDVASPPPTNPTVPTPGNLPLQELQNQLNLDLSGIAGQTPQFEWTHMPDQNGFAVRVTCTNAYFGYAPQYTSVAPPTTDEGKRLGWFTAQQGTEQDLAPIVIQVPESTATNAPMHTVFTGEPEVMHTISDFITFTVDETSSVANLTVKDRQIVLKRTESESDEMYPLFLTRSLANAFQSKTMVYDEKAGPQANVTLANMSVFSGMNLPIIQACILALANDLSRQAIPAYYTDVPSSKGPFTYYSPLFKKGDGSNDYYYKTSLFDLFSYFMNVRSRTAKFSISASSIGISESSPIRVVNPSGYAVAAELKNEPKAPGAAGEVSTEETFGSGINITIGAFQNEHRKLALNSYSVSAGASGIGAGAIPPVTANATYQNGNYTGNQLTSGTYLVSRFRTGAANQNAGNTNSNSSNAKKALARAIVSETVRQNGGANSNSNGNKNSNNQRR